MPRISPAVGSTFVGPALAAHSDGGGVAFADASTRLRRPFTAGLPAAGGVSVVASAGGAPLMDMRGLSVYAAGGIASAGGAASAVGTSTGAGGAVADGAVVSAILIGAGVTTGATGLGPGAGALGATAVASTRDRGPRTTLISIVIQPSRVAAKPVATTTIETRRPIASPRSRYCGCRRPRVFTALLLCKAGTKLRDVAQAPESIIEFWSDRQ